MAAIDKMKEQIGWLKVTFALLVAIDVSLIGWFVQNFNMINQFLLLATLVIVGLISIIILVISQFAYYKMNDLEDL